MKLLNKIILGVLFLSLAGCSPQVNNLISLSESRSQMEAEVKRQEALYLKLKEDIKDNRIKKGFTQKQIFSRYGKPVLIKPGFLLYRHPTQAFSSDLVYLYIDQKGVLVSWEIKPVG